MFILNFVIFHLILKCLKACTIRSLNGVIVIMKVNVKLINIDQG